MDLLSAWTHLNYQITKSFLLMEDLNTEIWVRFKFLGDKVVEVQFAVSEEQNEKETQEASKSKEDKTENIEDKKDEKTDSTIDTEIRYI